MIPLASRSKVTSICGTPRGAGGIPVSSNLPRRLLSLVRLTLTLEDLDKHTRLVVGEVEKTSDFLVEWWCCGE